MKQFIKWAFKEHWMNIVFMHLFCAIPLFIALHPISFLVAIGVPILNWLRIISIWEELPR